MVRLKADLHTHSGDDPYDIVNYSSEKLIDIVAAKGITALAITGHEELVFRQRMVEYARDKGVLLVPGLERTIEGKHVLMLNPDKDQAAVRTFAQLAALGGRDAAIIAPHPFFPGPSSLKEKLIEHIDLFHAIEYCSFYFPALNYNRKAVQIAKDHGLPMLGTSDSHILPYIASTFTWIDVEEATTEAVVDAIRSGRVYVETRPSPWIRGLTIGWMIFLYWVQFVRGIRKRKEEE